MMQWVKNGFQSGLTGEIGGLFAVKKLQSICRFHATIPGYRPTPLYALSSLAKLLGVGQIYVKDESSRFGLKAFKGLGASYAIASYLAREHQFNISSSTFAELKEQIQPHSYTFATATDGNHGKGVAWAARLFGQSAKVFLPNGTSSARLHAIRKLGAEAEITDLNYDDTVKRVASLAEKQEWVLVQDTAWEGYEQIPFDIMQGYVTIVNEIIDQLQGDSFDGITHIILQAGVGSFPAAIAAAITELTFPYMPQIFIVEPEKAACFYHSVNDSSGKPIQVTGELTTMMAGLACGRPNPLAWSILKSLGSVFFSCKDEISATGMRVLGNPIAPDERIIAGESGAAPLGLLYELLTQQQWQEQRREWGLDQSAKILLINTEGDTDPANYRRIVWEGAQEK
jgi:diaminopropionate ammonia-lyase